jgi:hypothetical protein
MESLNLINYSTLNIHVPCFCCHEFTLFLCYEKSLNFFLSLFLLFDALVGHQALVKQNKGPVCEAELSICAAQAWGVDGGITDL